MQCCVQHVPRKEKKTNFYNPAAAQKPILSAKCYPGALFFARNKPL
jgi:hypothetical protein